MRCHPCSRSCRRARRRRPRRRWCRLRRSTMSSFSRTGAATSSISAPTLTAQAVGARPSAWQALHLLVACARGARLLRRAVRGTDEPHPRCVASLHHRTSLQARERPLCAPSSYGCRCRYACEPVNLLEGKQAAVSPLAQVCAHLWCASHRAALTPRQHQPAACYATLCYATLCYAALCYAMLCYAALCCAMLRYAALRYAMQQQHRGRASS